MKKMNKLLALVLAMVMVLGLATTAFAEEGTTCTISAPAGSTHTYDIYQIFTGDLSGKVLSNVKWGQNGNFGENEKAGDAVPQSVLDALTAVSGKSDTEQLAVIENYVNLESNPVASLNETTTSATVAAGYYLIKDRDNTVTGTDSYTLYIVQIVGNITITPKSATPTFEKKLKDTNDTAGTTSGWQDSADWDIGDKVPFKLEGKVAANFSDYKTYYFAFHDKEEAGLTFDPTSVVVKVNGEVLDKQYYSVVTDTTDDCTFEVIFQELKGVPGVGNNAIITVEYESELNSNANIGNQGNVNQAKLEFSNNPNEEQSGETWTKPETGETPWDLVIVFTYKTVINKVDGKDAPLTGAAFKLEKLIKGVDNEADTWQTIKEFTVSEENPVSTFEFTGLDDGTYKLTETVTPAGYNTIDPITFTVTAEHTITWDGTNRTTVLTNLSGNAVTGEITFTSDTTEGSLSADVVNNAGTTLPETGGIGTTIFYVLGGMLVVCAVVLMVSKKRMSAEG